MVWRADNSPLYRSVEEFNRRTEEYSCGTNPVNGADTTEHDEKCKSCDSRERYEGCERKMPPPVHPQPSSSSPSRLPGLLGRIAGDKDMLLITALIILLWHEKADMKLIAALVYILLG